MNTIFLFIVAIPAIEIFLMIKIGQNIGAFNTILLIFITAVIGIYFAKIQGLSTLRSGVLSMYKNQLPLFEMISGASIAFAACLLIFPGFVTDTMGFFLLIPWTRKYFIRSFLKKKNVNSETKDYIEGEIVDKKNKEEGDDIIEGDEYRENLILQGLEILKEKQNGKLTKEQNRMLDRKDFKSLDEILRGNDIILLQNIVNGEFVYMPYNEYEKMSKELNQAGVFPVGQQFEQTSNPYEELEKVDKTPPPASNSDNLTNDNSDKGNIFDKMMDLIKDFELPFNKNKADITVPITIASAKRPSSMNDSNSSTDLGDINTGRLKYNEVFFNSIG